MGTRLIIADNLSCTVIDNLNYVTRSFIFLYKAIKSTLGILVSTNTLNDVVIIDCINNFYGSRNLFTYFFFTVLFSATGMVVGLATTGLGATLVVIAGFTTLRAGTFAGDAAGTIASFFSFAAFTS